MKRFYFIPLLFVILLALTPNQASAEIGGLTKCSESPAFQKRLIVDLICYVEQMDYLI